VLILFSAHQLKMEIVFGLSHPAANKTPKKTLILDLDESAVHSWENGQFVEYYGIYSDPVVYRKFHPLGSPQIAYSMLLNLPNGPARIWGLTRPYLYEFLAWANTYFDNIIVWSAGIQPYVEEIIRQIFLEAGLRSPKLVWARNRTPNYNGMYHKPIAEIIRELTTRPYTTVEIDPKWTVVVDDKQHTFMLNPNSGILIPPYHPGRQRHDKIPTMEDLLDRSDRCLLQLMAWFERPDVKSAPDITMVDKTRIFGN